jgi:hypothetical protein
MDRYNFYLIDYFLVHVFFQPLIYLHPIAFNEHMSILPTLIKLVEPVRKKPLRRFSLF